MLLPDSGRRQHYPSVGPGSVLPPPPSGGAGFSNAAAVGGVAPAASDVRKFACTLGGKSGVRMGGGGRRLEYLPGSRRQRFKTLPKTPRPPSRTLLEKIWL